MRWMACITLLALSTACLGETVDLPQSSFLGGEVSPYMVLRPDSPQYTAGCRIIENAEVFGPGIITRRPGTYYVATTKGDALAWLLPFVYNESDAYVMEFTVGKLRFYRGSGIVEDANSAIYEVNTPYAASDVNSLALYQTADVCYIVSQKGTYSPRKLVRTDHASWTLTDCNTLITTGPFRDINLTATALEVNDVNIGSTPTLTASADIFEPCQVGSLWKLQHVMTTQYQIGSLGHLVTNVDFLNDHVTLAEDPGFADDAPIRISATGTLPNPLVADTTYYVHAPSGTYLELSATPAGGEINLTNAGTGTIVVWGGSYAADGTTVNEYTPNLIAGIGAPYSFSMDSSWFKGTASVQVSYDNGTTWIDHYSAVNPSSRSVDINDNSVSDFGQNVLIRMALTEQHQGYISYTLDVESYVHTGILQATAYVDGNNMTTTVLDSVGSASTTTKLWAEGAWSEHQGYPQAVTAHFGRIVYAKDLTLWWSAVDDFENFYSGIEDDQSFSFSLSQAQQNSIRWLVGERSQNLVCGTLGKVMELRSLDELRGFTPTNPPKVASTVAKTVGYALPALADTALLFPDRTGKHLYEMLYDNSEGTITAPDLTVLASHISGTGIRQLAWQRSPYPILWCVRTDGQVATMYYDRSYKIGAWSRFVTDGDVKSVAVVPTDGGPDRVWLEVYRNGHYYIEYVKDLDPELAIEHAYYVDSGLSWDGGAAVEVNTISQAAQGQVTLSSWPTGLVDDDHVLITGVLGMTEINDRYFTAHDCNSVDKTLILQNEADTAHWDTSGYTAYASGGTLQRVEKTFSGLDHLEGNDVTILADGAVESARTVDANSVTLDTYANVVTIGLPYTTTVIPVEMEATLAAGSTAPFGKRILGVAVSLYDTPSIKYGSSTTLLRQWSWPRLATATTLSTVTPLGTGTIVLPGFGGYQTTAQTVLVQDEPLPLTIRAVTPIIEVNK